MCLIYYSRVCYVYVYITRKITGVGPGRIRAAHSVTARRARGVDCADVLPPARLPSVFPSATHRAGFGPPTVSRHEMSTVQMCCLRPVFPPVTQRAGFGPPTVSPHEVSTVQVCCFRPVFPSGRPQCHGTSCRLCRRAASGPGPVFPSVTHRAAGLARGGLQVSRLLEPRVWPALPLSPTRPGRRHRHADSDTNRSACSARKPRPAPGPGPGLHSFACALLQYTFYSS